MKATRWMSLPGNFFKLFRYWWDYNREWSRYGRNDIEKWKKEKSRKSLENHIRMEEIEDYYGRKVKVKVYHDQSELHIILPWDVK